MSPPSGSPFPQPWSWGGAIALVLACCLGLGWLLAVVAFAWAALRGEPPTADATQAVGGIGQVLAGALGTYLGFSVAAQHRAAAEGSQRRTAPPGA